MAYLILAKTTGLGNPVWDTSNPTYSGVFLDVSPQTTNPSGVDVKPDGTELYVSAGSPSPAVHRYTMSTPWDLSTASHTSTYSITTPPFSSAHYPYDIRLSSDGGKMWTSSHPGDWGFNEYSLSSAWDQTSASFVTTYAPTGDPQYLYHGFAFKPNGAKFYSVGYSGSKYDVVQHDVSTPWSLGTASYDNKKFGIGSQETRALALTFSTTGTKMWVGGNGNGASSSATLFQYTLSTEWDVSTASYDGAAASFDAFGVLGEDNIDGVVFNQTGSRLFLVGASGDKVYQVDFS